MDINLPSLKCTVCGHRWHPRYTTMPKICPRCKRHTVIECTPNSIEITNTALHILNNNGFNTELEHDCNSYGRIDILASKNDMYFIIEVKPSHTKTNILFGVGQLLYYESILQPPECVKILLYDALTIDESLINFFKKYDILHATLSELGKICQSY